MMTRIWARTFSRTIRSMVTMFLTARTSSCAIIRSVASPSTFTPLLFTH